MPILIGTTSGIILLALNSPPVEGDPLLFDVVRGAQAANLERLGKGELLAEDVTGVSDDETPICSFVVRTVWDGQRAYFDSSETAFSKHVQVRPVPGDPTPPPAKTTRVTRIALDGSRCIEYESQGEALRGEVNIYPQSEFHSRIRQPHIVDQRPASLWYSFFGTRRRLEELIGPHPKFPADDVQKWAVKSEGSRVIVQRYDRQTEGKPVVVQMIYDLDVNGGLVSQSGHRGSQATLTWLRRSEGFSVLDRATYISGRDKEGRQVVRTITIKKFDPNPATPAALFTMESLRIRPGTRVTDKTTGRTYSYGGRPVTQTDLDRLIHAGKKRRDAEKTP